ncbi:hypothetical protein F5Y03DRAFT_348659 [Xylaria venustula]|nr:hypothetical protein F5Y03DRAFT_348659 [Xylaria venustula]
MSVECLCVVLVGAAIQVCSRYEVVCIKISSLMHEDRKDMSLPWYIMFTQENKSDSGSVTVYPGRPISLLSV